MTTRKKQKTTALAQEAIDRIAVDQADDDSAWEEPVRVQKSKQASVPIPGELEELAFAEAKKKLGS